MDNDSKKAAIAAYKNREANAGIYMLRCAEAGQQWVGYTPDFDAIMNRVTFSLRFGNHRSRTLQAAWNQHGQACLVLEQVERFDPKMIPTGEALKARLVHWQQKLDALPL